MAENKYLILLRIQTKLGSSSGITFLRKPTTHFFLIDGEKIFCSVGRVVPTIVKYLLFILSRSIEHDSSALVAQSEERLTIINGSQVRALFKVPQRIARV